MDHPIDAQNVIMHQPVWLIDGFLLCGPLFWELV